MLRPSLRGECSNSASANSPELAQLLDDVSSRYRCSLSQHTSLQSICTLSCCLPCISPEVLQAQSQVQLHLMQLTQVVRPFRGMHPLQQRGRQVGHKQGHVGARGVLQRGCTAGTQGVSRRPVGMWDAAAGGQGGCAACRQGFSGCPCSFELPASTQELKPWWLCNMQVGTSKGAWGNTVSCSMRGKPDSEALAKGSRSLQRVHGQVTGLLAR